jgi:preprotein translocase subunit SecA
LDAFLDSLDVSDEEDTRRPADLLAELNLLTRANFKLSPEQQRQLRESPQTIAPALRTSVIQAVRLQEAGRTLGAIERRLNEPLDLAPNGLPLDDWPTLTDIVLQAVEGVLRRRRERLLGQDGLVTRDLESALAKLPADLDEQHLLYLLLILPQGARASFDRKTHRKFMQRTTRLQYVYAAARLIEGRERDEVGEDVLRHLEEAQAAMRQAFGETALAAAGNATLGETTLRAQRGLREVLGEEAFFAYREMPLASLPDDARELVIDELGRQTLTENYRQLILRVISELWIDYLTDMEALRVAIGLEAYAQRDPLVQYKNKASELFQELMSNMRLGVIGRMFTFRLREPEAATARPDTSARFDRAEPEAVAAESAPAAEATAAAAPKGGKRRRRKR